MSGIIKDIYLFFKNYFKIYKSSQSSNVSKWTYSDVEEAIKWSICCQELSVKLKNKPQYDVFLQELRKIMERSKSPLEGNDTSIINDLITNATNHMKSVNKFFFLF